uniref:Glycine receptor, beta subunit n=1 Tax=Mus musculus TaxID=10090 RepID=E9Q9K1_MOUSE
MKFSLAISFFILMSLLFEDACAKEKSSKKGKGKKKQYLCPSSHPRTWPVCPPTPPAIS